MSARFEFTIHFMELLNNMAVLILTAYVFSRTKIYEDLQEKKFTFKNVSILIILMGSLSIYGTVSGVRIMGNIANIRNIGPMITGFIAGPVAGMAVGFIAGFHRMAVGGNSAFPCSMAAVLAGFFAGIVFHLNKKKLPSVWFSALFAAIIELFHSTLVILLYGFDGTLETFYKNFPIACQIEAHTTAPRVILVSLGMGIFAFIIDNLREQRMIKEEKEKAERELKVARDIQMSIVPKIFPTFPDNQEIEIYAYIVPAKEVAGDFYDFFFIDERNVCFSIGDVADKGVPSSLFMAVTKTLLKAKYENGMTPAELLFKVNNELCEGNDNMMFVTVFLCIINLDSGIVQFSNGGHNLPYKFTNKGDVEVFPKTKGPALGVMPDSDYELGEIVLKPNEGIFLYTDGVNEAEDTNGQFFGYDRLVKELSKNCDKSSKQIVENMNICVNEFYKGLDPHDDVTINTVRYFGKEE